MRASQIRKIILPVFTSLISLLVFVGCSKRYQLGHESFPHEGSPEGAVVSMYFNENGNFFIADSDGKPLKAKPMSFSCLLKSVDRSKPGWIKLLGSYSVFQIEKNNSVLLCNKELLCIEGRVGNNPGQAVFSANYDGDSNKIFFANALGEKVEVVGPYMGATTAKSSDTKAMGWKVDQKRLKPFDELIENNNLSAPDEIKMLNTFIVFEIRGSRKLSIWNPFLRRWIVTCVDGLLTCSPRADGSCPGSCSE